MKRPTNLKIGDQFRVIEGYPDFSVGEIITLQRDDGTDRPFFWKEDRSDWHYIYFSKLEPYQKTVRDVQIGNVVVDKDDVEERMVLERGQNSVLLSYADNFKKASDNYTFDELEEYYTLKDTPELEQRILTMNEIAEKFGIEVSNLKIIKE